MNLTNISPYWVLVVLGTIVLAALAWFFGDAIYPDPVACVMAVAFLGVLMLLLRGPLTAAWLWGARYASGRHDERYERAESARATTSEVLYGEEGAKRWRDALTRSLRGRYWWFWRYRCPWILLMGKAETVGRISPDLFQHGYAMNSDVMLLWVPMNAEGRPDANWLTQLRRLRRRCPIDALCVVLDSEKDRLSTSRGATGVVTQLGRTEELLHWKAPTFILDINASGEGAGAEIEIAGCEFSPEDDEPRIQTALDTLGGRLVRKGVHAMDVGDGAGAQAKAAACVEFMALARLSQRLDLCAHSLSGWLASLIERRVRGIFFILLPGYSAEAQAFVDESGSELALTHADFSAAPLWPHLAKLARRAGGQRTAWHPATVSAAIVVGVIGLWVGGMLLSAVVNRHEAESLRHVVQRVGAPYPSERLRGLLALQQEIARYEYRTTEHAPWMTRFGLNQDQAVLQALWRPYQRASQALLIAPLQQTLETELIDLAQVRTDQIAPQASSFVTDGHQSLKTYLMLAEPQRSEAAFLAPQLMRRWRLDARLGSGEQHDMGQRLFTFYAGHLPQHPEWRLAPSSNLVTAARATLLTAIGVERADTTLYRHILAGAADKYSDQNLPLLTLGTDARGLVRSNAMVSGLFTRQAYEGSIAPAIVDAARRAEMAGDWVLGAAAVQEQARIDAQSPQELQQALTARYFEEYAEQWQVFMNSLQWESAATMPATIEQLKLMTDARQSPVLALMRSLYYQGNVGQRQATLSDTLVAKAQAMMGNKKGAVPQAVSREMHDPLNDAFGPVMRLVGNIDGAPEGAGNSQQGNGEISLQRYLDRVSALRLKLQQINSSADGEMQARQLAMSLFQGRGSELADTQAYAQLVAASLGEQWAAMGEALFVRPVAQATQTLLQPVQASLNEAWSNSVSSVWQRAFNGRYPFTQTDNDASLPELARFLRPQGGLIPAFLQAQLAGVLELQGDRWVPVPGHKLNFDPAFLTAINTLQRVGTQLLIQGEPQYRFDLKPIAQAPIRDVSLRIDGQTLDYNNMREHWKSLVWPAPIAQDAGARLQWETEQAGVRKHDEFTGRWAWIRMLERARVEPLDGATYQLSWQGPGATGTAQSAAAEPASSNAVDDADHMLPRAPAAAMTTPLAYPLTYLMRTEAGRGPLEILALRDFVLPSRIFVAAARSSDHHTKR